MSGIRGRDTRPELIIRKSLHREGFRYRLHGRDLPGKPDLIFPKYKAVILVDGCFWHGHDCHLFKWPKTRTAFWKEKINGNRKRDAENLSLLLERGWRVLRIRECALKGKKRLPLEDIVQFCCGWLNSDLPYASVSCDHTVMPDILRGFIWSLPEDHTIEITE